MSRKILDNMSDLAQRLTEKAEKPAADKSTKFYAHRPKSCRKDQPAQEKLHLGNEISIVISTKHE